VTTNPGCQLHIGGGLKARGINARIVHVAQLLDEAIANAKILKSA
jgi:Fe-S oxidoreductase